MQFSFLTFPWEAMFSAILYFDSQDWIQDSQTYKKYKSLIYENQHWLFWQNCVTRYYKNIISNWDTCWQNALYIYCNVWIRYVFDKCICIFVIHELIHIRCCCWYFLCSMLIINEQKMQNHWKYDRYPRILLYDHTHTAVDESFIWHHNLWQR